MTFFEAQGLGIPRCVQQYTQSSDLQPIHLRCQVLRPLSLLLVVNFSILRHEPGQIQRNYVTYSQMSQLPHNSEMSMHKPGLLRQKQLALDQHTHRHSPVASPAPPVELPQFHYKEQLEPDQNSSEIPGHILQEIVLVQML